MTTFCEDNQYRKAEFGGIISTPDVAAEAWEHLNRVVDSWNKAFDSPLISKEAFTQFLDFDKEIIQTIVKSPECVSLRIFPGFDDNGKFTVALIGVNRDNHEIINKGNIPPFTAGNLALLAVACCPSNGSSKVFPK
ncbi:hypothetical protein GCM10023187_24150 [Nibrella viscosa]|uniref:Uncharacterized protein n=1 Tax=Nibrella viscosa TaxID=1084524 RepID=A0ABP8KFG6_9BACT